MNLFKSYYNYVKKSEPPLIYQTWTCIGIISALLGRKSFFPMGHFTVFPQLYVMLVGSPALRKSTALNESERFLKRMKKANIASRSTTREQIISDFVSSDAMIRFNLGNKEFSYQQMAIIASEFNEFIGGKHINEGMIRFLTDMWDANRIDYKTKNQGKFSAENPYLTLIGACTTNWINRSLKSGIITDGFSRRTIFAYADKKNCSVARPIIGLEEIEARSQIVEHFLRIEQIKGEFVFTEPADELYEKFYEELEDFDREAPPLLQYYYATKGTLAIKVAMCLSAAYTNSRIIDSGMLKLSLKLLEEVEKDLPRVLGGLGRNELKSYLDQVLEYIQKHPGITKGQIAGQFYGDLVDSELTEILKVLSEMKEVTVELAAGGVDFRYSATKGQTERREANLLQALSHFEPLKEPILTTSVPTDIEETLGQVPPQSEEKKLTGLIVKQPDTQK